MSGKSRNKHNMYDLELFSLRHYIAETLKSSDVKWTKFKRKNFIEAFDALAINYCKDKRINPKTSTIIIAESDSTFYNQLLICKLCFMNPKRIRAFLYYQRKNFKDNLYATKENFIGFLNFLVLPQIQKVAPLRSKTIQKVILKWIEDNTTGPVIKSPQKGLEWRGKKEELNSLSQQVNIDGYTATMNAFRKVFDERAICKCTDDPYVIAYLVSVLYRNKMIKVLEGGKGVLKLASAYFFDYSAPIPAPININSMAYEIRKNRVLIAKKAKKRVGEWIKSSFPKKKFLLDE